MFLKFKDCSQFFWIEFELYRICFIQFVINIKKWLFYFRPLHELETLWLKDGIPVENTGIGYNLNDPWNRTLSLLSANLTHTGKYTCQARLRTGGFPTVSADANIVVLGNQTVT